MSTLWFDVVDEIDDKWDDDNSDDFDPDNDEYIELSSLENALFQEEEDLYYLEMCAISLNLPMSSILEFIP